MSTVIPEHPAHSPKQPKLSLSDRPDGLGYFYGDIKHNGQHHTVNVLPPLNEWVGDIMPKGEFAPDSKQYILYLDGEEIARVGAMADITMDLLDRPRSEDDRAVGELAIEKRGIGRIFDPVRQWLAKFK